MLSEAQSFDYLKAENIPEINNGGMEAQIPAVAEGLERQNKALLQLCKCFCQHLQFYYLFNFYLIFTILVTAIMMIFIFFFLCYAKSSLL